MCGIFDFDIQMSKRLRSLGYREIELQSDTLIGKKGDIIRGHEFHYSSISNSGSSLDSDSNPGQLENAKAPEGIYKVASRAGQQISLQGFQRDNTLGSYLHVHFGSNPNAARQFVNCCAQWKKDSHGKGKA